MKLLLLVLLCFVLFIRYGDFYSLFIIVEDRKWYMELVQWPSLHRSALDGSSYLPHAVITVPFPIPEKYW